MMNKFKFKPKNKDVNGSEKQSQAKKSSVKNHEASNTQINRPLTTVNSVPLARKSVVPPSPISNHKMKMSREPSCASIPSPNRVTSFVSYNDSIDRSVNSDISNNAVTIDKLKREIHDLRLQYLADYGTMRRENYDIQQDSKKTKREMYDVINEHNERLKAYIDKLDVEQRMLDKLVYNLQSHYGKFIPFLLKHLSLLMKNQEYLTNRIKQLEYPQSNVHKLFQSANTNRHSTTSSRSIAYSISISSVSDEGHHYRLVFRPIEELYFHRFTEEAKEHEYTMPLVERTYSSSSTLSPSSSDPCHRNDSRSKPVLGSKAIPYHLRRSTNAANNSGVYSEPINDSHHRKTVDPEYIANTFSVRSTEHLRFKDLKKRYCKRNMIGLRYQTYPWINTPIFGSEVFKINLDISLSDQMDSDTADSNLLLCQSDTDLFRMKGNEDSSERSGERSSFHQCPLKTVLYQRVPVSLVRKLQQLRASQEELPSLDPNENDVNGFSVILSRSKLSLLINHNFADLPCGLHSTNTNNDATLNTKYGPANVINDSDYFTYFPNKLTSQKLNLTSVETLSDHDSFIDDDYGQQVLLADDCSGNCLLDSYDQLCTDLDRFSLPGSSLNDVFEALRNK